MVDIVSIIYGINVQLFKRPFIQDGLFNPILTGGGEYLLLPIPITNNNSYENFLRTKLSYRDILKFCQT